MDLANTEDVNKFEIQRQEKLSRIKESGLDPYGGLYEAVESAEDIKNRFIRYIISS